MSAEQTQFKASKSTAVHQAFRDHLTDFIETHGDVLGTSECLAMAAQIVGHLVAYNDPNAVAQGDVIELVQVNMQLGNDAACELIREAHVQTPEGATLQ